MNYTGVRVILNNNIKVGDYIGAVTEESKDLEANTDYVLQFKIINYTNENILDHIVAIKKNESIRISESLKISNFPVVNTFVDENITKKERLCHIIFKVSSTGTYKFAIARSVTSNDVAGSIAFDVREISVEKGSILQAYKDNTEDLNSFIRRAETYFEQTDSRLLMYAKKEDNNKTQAQIEITANNIMSSVENEIEGTKSLITQTAKDVRYEFKQHSACPNLLTNGAPTSKNMSGWSLVNSASGGVVQLAKNDTNYLSFCSTNTNEVFCYHDAVGVSGSTDYSLSILLRCQSNVKSYDVYIIERDSSNNSTAKQLIAGAHNEGWVKYKFNFTTKPSTISVELRIDHNGLIDASAGNLYLTLTNAMLIKGYDYFPDSWYPCPEEIMSNTTTINGKGIEIRHNNGSKAQWNSSGLWFYNEAGEMYSAMIDGKHVFCRPDGVIVGLNGRSVWKGTNTYLNGLNAAYGHTVGIGACFKSNESAVTDLVVSSIDQSLDGRYFRQGLNIIVAHILKGLHFHYDLDKADDHPAFIAANTSRELLVASDGSVKICSWAGYEKGNNVGYEAKKETVSPWVSNHMYGDLYMHNWAIYNSGWINPVSAASSASFRLKAIDSTDYSSPYREDITNFYGVSSTTNGEVRYTDRETHITSISLKYDDDGNILKDENGNYVYEDIPSCIIEIPYYMAENIEDSYHVNITPAEFGFYRVKEKNRYYFVVESQDDGFPFTFEVVAKRLEVPQGNNAIVANIQNAYDPNIVEAEIESSVITDV